MYIAEIFRSIQGEGRLTGVESIFVRASGCNLRCCFCDTRFTSWTPEGEDLSVDEILTRIDELRRGPRPAFLAAHFLKAQADACKCPPPSLDDIVAAEITGHELPSTCAGSSPPSEAVNKRGLAPSQPTIPSQEGDDARRLSPFVRSLSPPAPLRAPTEGRSEEGRSAEVRHIVLTGGEPMLFAELIPLTARLRDEGWHITIETSGTLFLPVACDLMSISPKLSNSTPSPEIDPRWTWRHTLNRHAPDVMRRLLASYDYQLKFVVDRVEDCAEVDAYLSEFPQLDQGRVMLMPQGVDISSLDAKSLWLEPHCHKNGFVFCPRRHVEWFGSQRGR